MFFYYNHISIGLYEKNYTIACGTTSIIFKVDIVEENFPPKELDTKLSEDDGGKTVGLLLRMAHII